MTRFSLRLLVAGLVAAAGVWSTAMAGATSDKLATRWEVATLAGAPAVPGGDITFENGNVSGATACNLYGGTFATAGEDGLTITLGRMTRRGCSGEAMQRERALIEAFEATRRFRMSAEALVLLAADGKELATFKKVGNAALEGPKHKIVSFLRDGGLHSTVAGSGASVTFKGGRIELATGCRTFSGVYRLVEGKLEIEELTELARQQDPCPAELTDQDAGIIDALPLATGFDTARNLIRLLEPEKGWAVLWITPEW